jgi:hypothetical protein
MYRERRGWDHTSGRRGVSRPWRTIATRSYVLTSIFKIAFRNPSCNVPINNGSYHLMTVRRRSVNLVSSRLRTLPVSGLV